MSERESKLISLIDDIVDGEWWQKRTGEAYVQAGIKMLAYGMSSSDIVEILESLYLATAGEFGY